MQVKVKLHSILRDYLPREAKGKATVELPAEATVTDLLTHLKIERDCLVVVNGEEVIDNTQILRNGDDVQMLIALGGGN